MLAFGFALQAHNPFLGYEGDFDSAASACFRTAGVFGVIGAVSAVSFVAAALRSKMSSSSAPVARGDYQAV